MVKTRKRKYLGYHVSCLVIGLVNIPLFATNPIKLPPAESDVVEVKSDLTTSPDTIFKDPNVISPADSPVYKLKEDSLPDGYGFMIFSSTPLPDDKNWWHGFDDPILSRLETLGVRNNYNIKAMLKRIEAARQMLRQIKSGYYPTLSLSIGYNANRDSGRESVPYATAQPATFFTAGATMSWEIDIFGRIAEKAKAENANIDVTRLEYEGMLLSLSAEIASNYSAFRMYEQQLSVAMSHLKSQEDILNIAEARYKAGLVSKLDVAQAKNMVSTTRLLIPKYRALLTSARNALATLCGVNSVEIDKMVGQGDMPHLMSPLQVGVPADLIRRRPDVAEAEAQIENIAAKLGVSKKQYLPSLTIDATIASTAHEAKYFFGDHSLTFSVTPTLNWTLFDGFSREAAVAQIRAEMESQIETYNYTLTTAVQEVEDAMQLYIAAGRELTLYADVLENSNEVVSLSLERYRHGLTDFTDVANAQISYLQNHTNYQSARANLFNCIVNLYKALGGGYNDLNINK
ncbi:MAG: TolC family protein [Muribaculaceae bacterium]|nr:TolC family protein [Muribaculaceae bacterium]